MHRRNGLVLLALGAVAVAGCGGAKQSTGAAAKPANPGAADVSPAGDIPDSQAFVAYSPPGGGYSVKVPEGWARSRAGHAVVFTDKLNSIRMEPGSGSPPPAGARRSVVRRSAGRVVRYAYTAKGSADPVTGKAGAQAVERYVYAKTGRPVSLTLTAPKGADNVDPWRVVTDSFRWTR